MRKIGLFCLVLFLTCFVGMAMAEVQRDSNGADILQSVASTEDVNRQEVITVAEVRFSAFNDTAVVVNYGQMTSQNGALSAMAETLTAKGDRSPVFYYASMAISPSLTINV